MQPEEADSLARIHWDNNSVWFDRKIERRGVQFLVVGGSTGTIYRASNDLFDFPEESELRELAERTGEIPFAWSKPCPPEELAA